MNTTEKLKLIHDFEHAYEPIGKLVEGLSGAELRFVPPIADAWSTNDHLVHILDAETSAFFRIRAAIAEPGLLVPVWEEEFWRIRLPYEKQDGLACIKIVFGLRRTMAESLRAIVEADWEGYWIQHPVRGRMTLADILIVYRDHAAFHQPFIQRNREVYVHRG